MKTIFLGLVSAGLLLAADNDTTRGIVPEEVLKARPQTPVAAAKKPTSAPVYQGTGGGAAKPAAGARQVGVTIWRLRPASQGGTGARILVQEETATTEFVPERVGSTTSLQAGDRVRLTVESPETGYLYVIDRERYASGERGAPWLIFPTTRTRDGDNRVTAGKLIDIPGQADRPNFFSLRQSRVDQTEEELSLILSKEPLEGIQIGAQALQLTSEQVAGWERRWGAGRVESFELAGGAGRPWTRNEQQAAADTTRVLTQEDPAPQTVYRVVSGTASKPSEPFLVKVRLRYSSGR